jgi:superfamily II DNA helicase RecQ
VSFYTFVSIAIYVSKCFSDFPWSNRVREVLNSVFKLDGFRPLQHETINATMSNEDVILIMPTGGGKSLCYQLPALLKSGNIKVV